MKNYRQGIVLKFADFGSEGKKERIRPVANLNLASPGRQVASMKKEFKTDLKFMLMPLRCN